MTQTAADALTIWAPAIRQRRKAMLQRIVMGAATALVFSPMLGLRFSAMWLAIYTLIQFLEARVFAPVIEGRITEPSGVRGLYGDLVLILNAGFFAVKNGDPAGVLELGDELVSDSPLTRGATNSGKALIFIDVFSPMSLTA